MRLRRLVALLLALGLAIPQAAAFQSFYVEHIEVEGLQRIAVGTVFNYLPMEIGDEMTPETAQEAIRALYQTGFFADVALDRDGNTLVIRVQERPSIADIQISGNRDIETDELLENLRRIDFAQGRTFDRHALEQVEQELTQLYLARGKYGVQVETTVTPLERNRVGISIDIAEGRVARIQHLNIVGNEAFDDETLRREFELRTPGYFFGRFSRRSQYAREQLQADLESVRSYYLNRGYVNFAIDSSQVSVSPDRESVYITVNVSEGDQYRVSDVSLAGDLIVPEEELQELIQVQEGEFFSRRDIVDTSEAISRRLGDEGYAFSNINPVPEIDEENKEVSLTFFVDPGRRVYVRRINITGNTRTQDEVIRRELRQMEGTWLSMERLERSRERIDRLGFFEQVQVETPQVPGSEDQVDVNIDVTERATGHLMMGVGYSQAEGALFNASLTQENFMGTGNRVNATFLRSSLETVYRLTHTNPYITPDGVSRTLSGHYRESDPSQVNIAAFTFDAYGGSVEYGIPFTDHTRIRMGLSGENLQLSETDRTPEEYRERIEAEGDEFDFVNLTLGWTRDTRNRGIFPTRGSQLTADLEMTAPGMDTQFYKTRLRHQQWVPLTDLFTLRLNGEVAYGDGIGDTDRLPFFEHYFAGGPRSVRGFRDNTLGPKSAEESDALGGNLRTVANLGVIFPPPWAPDNRQFRFELFADAGSVFDTREESEDHSFDVDGLRYSAGLGMTWLSPMGPLRFSYAFPFNEGPEDRTQSFQFTLGVSF